jgi:signal transduction histidine kinase
MPGATSDFPYRTLLEAMPAIAFTATEGGEFLFVSAAWKTLTGRDPKTALAFGWLDLISVGERKRVRREWLSACKRGAPWQSWLPLSPPQGGVCQLLMTAAPAPKAAAASYIGNLVVCPPPGITDQRLLETLRFANLGMLVSAIAHEFNNLLAGIIGNSGLIRRTIGVDSGAHRNLQRIDHASERAAVLCRQISAYSVQQSNQWRRIRLNDLVAESAPLLHLAARGSTELRIKTSTPLPPVRGDEAQLRHLLMTLVTTGAATAGGGRRITLRTGRWTPESRPRADGAPDAALLELRWSGGDRPLSVREGQGSSTPALESGADLSMATIEGIAKAHGALLSIHCNPTAGGESWIAVHFPA